MDLANKAGLIVGPDEAIKAHTATLLGLQHVLAMDVYVPPFIIAGLLAMSMDAKMALIQITFFAAGIGTILQTRYFMKMPMTQGPSFVPIGAIAGIYLANGGGQHGLATVFGSLLVGAVLVILFGLSGFFQKIIRYLVPSLVGGTIITVVGLSLIPSALNDNIFQAGGNLNQNVILGVVTATILVTCVAISLRFPRLARAFKVSSIIIALLGGSLLAASMGRFSFKSIATAPWFSLPSFAVTHYGFHFSLSAILTMIVIYAVLLTETSGTWFAMSAILQEPMTDKQWNRGIIGEGLSCLIAALAGSTPMTGYSTNAGVISITGVASKRAFIAAGVWFIGFSFIGKLAAFLAAIPAPVIGGVFAIICSTIMLSGLQVIRQQQFAERDLYIIGLPIIMTLALILIPEQLTKEAPQLIQYLLSSPVAVSAILAIALNQILPQQIVPAKAKLAVKEQA
ncbi:uracil-xanthine transport protein [Loigolactobacillus rennini DSM 20253]|uniref:Uracil-xanthine transport protein n=1 Tax=Loigolactobacillus rennini DSM 20253 TaxID=1423796 RepID=A0A0R2DG22_9LACO|nr:solute carrier family 23 protein [Loigolactobacillus rennini]KRM99371.1 uracil-xanthine transport protein [Loigolactobacillus rennini DSM 20253]